MDQGPLFFDHFVDLQHINTGFGPFDFSQPDGIADPGLVYSPYASSIQSQFLTPSSASCYTPDSSIDCFGDFQAANFNSNTNNNTKPVVLDASFTFDADQIATLTPTIQDAPLVPPTKTKKAKAPAKASAPAKVKLSTTTTGRKKSITAKKATAKSATPPPTYDIISSSSSSGSGVQRKKKTQQPKSSGRKPSSKRGKDVYKRNECLERNRIAASKCRQRKKEWVHDLEGTKYDMEQRHETLRMEYMQLVEEVTQMKNQLMAHAVCNDQHITTWIKQEAVKFVEKITNESQTKQPSLSSRSSYSAASSLEPESGLLSPSQLKVEPFEYNYLPDERFLDESL